MIVTDKEINAAMEYFDFVVMNFPYSLWEKTFINLITLFGESKEYARYLFDHCLLKALDK